MFIVENIKKNIKYLLTIILSTTFFLWWISNAGDLLWQIMKPSYDHDTIITIWENVDTVWNAIIKWPTKVNTTTHGTNWSKNNSIIVQITKILLSLVIALSITMILYNGMKYIIQTWQWSDSKWSTKNIIYIVVGILIALFSVVIITIIQSVPKTLDEELKSDNINETDNSIIDNSENHRIF